MTTLGKAARSVLAATACLSLLTAGASGAGAGARKAALEAPDKVLTTSAASARAAGKAPKPVTRKPAKPKPTPVAPTTAPAPAAPPSSTPSTSSPPAAPPAPIADPTSQPPATPGFVTRSGSTLMLAGKPFRFTGANLYWLGLDDNQRDASDQPTYPTHHRIDNGLDSAAAMNASVVRSHTLGISVGCPRCLQPARGQFNDAAFESIDYAIAAAGRRNLRLMIPLVDQWHYYHGGKHTFTGWNGVGEGSFYTDQNVINDFRGYVSHLLNHVNQYTGVALKDDPTIMAWETGNEIWDAPASWTAATATYLKGTAGARQLVADGTAAGGMHTANAAVGAADVDILGGHFYGWPSGLDTNWLATDAKVARDTDKAYIVGEFAWSRPELPAFLSSIESNPDVAGALAWTILPYCEDGSPLRHGSTQLGDDDVSLYNPGTSAAMTEAFDRLARHGAAMRG